MAETHSPSDDSQAAEIDVAHPNELCPNAPVVTNEKLLEESYPYRYPLRSDAYKKQIRDLQIELLKVQKWVKDTQRKVVVLFEGRDAAGKGGVIKRFTQHLNPRHFQVIALEKPTVEERGQWYFQRYVQHLPSNGEMLFFDRSWYNRAGVEQVMGYCRPDEYREFLRQVPEFERMLTRSGIILFKYWFAVSQAEQLRRLNRRKEDPIRQWKLSPIDYVANEKYQEYSEARDAMFFFSHTKDAPWTVINSDDKRRARLNCLRHFLISLNYPDKDRNAIRLPDPMLVGPALKESHYSRRFT